jgi:uncharacterized integral membrane protein (TIGR00698 family)
LLIFRYLGVACRIDSGLTTLLAAGTAICGASAVVAVSAVQNSSESDTAYAVGSVTFFGTILMLAVPVLGAACGLDSQGIGLWAGASIHEVAQAVAAGLSIDARAGEVATVVKLARVVALAPLVGVLFACGRSTAGSGPGTMTIPWFVLGFVLAILVRNLGILPDAVLEFIPGVASILLCMAIGALTAQLNWAMIAARGFRPLLAAATGAAFIAGTTLVGLLLLR